jgi:hypothetical protein
VYFYDALTRSLVRYLTVELPSYQRRVPNDMDRMLTQLRPGDVVLVEGKTRISRVIMYLTQSSWSHAAMYIGDALLRWGGPHAKTALDLYGPEAAHLLLESDMREGVRVLPMRLYGQHNLRVCRPHSLSDGERERVLEEMLRHLGTRYDQRNIFDLGRYLTPFHLLPARWRRRPLYLGSSTSREIICSALIAKAFYRVDYPVQPLMQNAPDDRRGRITVRHPSYIMPRDFDLSPGFEVLKFHLPVRIRSAYRAPAPR